MKVRKTEICVLHSSLLWLFIFYEFSVTYGGVVVPPVCGMRKFCWQTATLERDHYRSLILLGHGL